MTNIGVYINYFDVPKASLSSIVLLILIFFVLASLVDAVDVGLFVFLGEVEEEFWGLA